MKIFITGCTGFIGQHLLKQLVGHEILCLTRSPTTNIENVKVQFVVGDLRNCSTWALDLAKFAPDIAIHLAWQGLPDYSKEACELNISMSLKLLTSLIDANVKRVVVAGSCFEYGLAEGELRESFPVETESDFAKAKLRILDEFDIACREAQIELVWSRIFYSFGPGQRDSSLLPSVYRSLASGKKPLIKMPGAVQDFIFIDDVASALVKLAITKSLEGVFNIGSGISTSVAELVNLIAKYCGSDFYMENTDTLLGSWASTDKIINLTGWQPHTSLEQGVRQTVRELETKSFG